MTETRSERRMRENKRRPNSSSPLKWLYRIALIGGLFTFFAGVVLGYYSSVLTNFMGDISVSDKKSLVSNKKINDGKPFSVLLLGMDADEDPRHSRTDTIIVATINPEKESVKMVSIPRDTLRELPNGMLEKINAAYAYGGMDLIKEVVSDYLQIPIDFFATIDFGGLVKLVNAVGGITVNSDIAFTEESGFGRGVYVDIKKGKQRLNGEEALTYARMRKQDPRGDFGRQMRQKEVIVSIVNELKSVNTITNLQKILKSLKSHVKTDISKDNMLAALNQYQAASAHIETLEISGFDGSAYFPHYGLTVWVWQAHPDSLLEVQNTLRKHLGLKPHKELQNNAVIEYDGYDSGVQPGEVYDDSQLNVAPEDYIEYNPSAPQAPAAPQEESTGTGDSTPPAESNEPATPPVETTPPAETGSGAGTGTGVGGGTGGSTEAPPAPGGGNAE